MPPNDAHDEEIAPAAAVEVVPAPPSEETHRLVFTGKGREYFGIWIVNLLLTIVSLGLYAPWAKVRRMQYFYRNTQLAYASFDYHGNAFAILKGRLLAIGMLQAYNLGGAFNPTLGAVVALVVIAFLPRLLLRSLQFRLYNSSYRGLRFRFNGRLQDAYLVFLGWPLLSALTLFLLTPFCHQRLKAFQHNNAAFGRASFSFTAPVRAFYGCYLKIAAVVIVGLCLIGGVAVAFFGGAVWLTGGRPSAQALSLLPLFFSLCLFLLFFFIRPFVEAQLQNLVWNHTHLGEHRFVSTVSAVRLFWIMLTNLIGILATLGLYRPFAVVRLLRYRLQTVAMVAQGDLDRFVADGELAVSATGEETADLFDIDIAL